ncbi:glycosyltransferase family 4 protein [Pandoraea commovens]|uniref:Glycosyltransferase family 4 protein n=2 Tax=Pandoraea commovens TaxID=2508289 RepID=A0ABY5QE47_9BURK|nr:glycosyltransferase family 4 protein [Pandoraea commovens]UVA78869.1 glycosyltransferase family 4 protein [Pandoraea commovens]
MATSMASPVLLCSNTFWSIYNFRRGPIAALLAAGHPVHVAAPDDEFAARLAEMGCVVHCVPMAAKGQNPVQDLGLMWRLYRLYRKVRPAVVFHYTIKPNIYGSIAAHFARIPAVSMTTGLGYVFIRESLTTRLARQLYRVAFRHTLENWFLNVEDHRAFVDGGLVALAKTRLLPGEGVDLAHFAKAPWPASDTSPDQAPSPMRFLLIARLLRDKGVLEYVEAARTLRAQMPHVTFQILGAADVENPTAISRSEVEAWQREGIVEYLGTTSDVRPLIANAHCVVLPSYREGLSRTLLEASAMGRPLIASDVPGCRDVIDNGVTGHLVPARDAAALTACLRAVAGTSSAALAQMGDAGRAKVAREFDEHVVIAEYFRILGSLPASC